jgi:hypothetical protein
MEAVRIALRWRCSNQSTLYARTVITVLASNRSFSHFHPQVEHNASLFQYVLERDELYPLAKIEINSETCKYLKKKVFVLAYLYIRIPYYNRRFCAFLDKPSGIVEFKFDRTAPNEKATDCNVYGFPLL